MLRLRPFRDSDAGIIASWITSEYAFRLWSADRYDHYPITGADIIEHYAGLSGSDRFFPMTAEDETGMVGHLIMRFTDDERKTLRFGFIIVDDSKRGKGYGKEMLSVAVRHAAEVFSPEKITIGVFENNPGAYYCYKAAGFRDVTAEPAEYYHVMGEDWKCLEMEMVLAEHRAEGALRTDLPGILQTERLILRRWDESDADDLFKYASDPDVGPIAGWPPHNSVDESRDVIRNVLNGREAYAICLKEDGKAIGAIELKLNGYTEMTDRDDECEMGFWLGKPFWGQGIMPEAVMEVLRHAFEDCGMQKVWIGYYEGNTKSGRVQEKCGFKYQRKAENVDVPLMREKRTSYVSLMTKEDWLKEQERVQHSTGKDR